MLNTQVWRGQGLKVVHGPFCWRETIESPIVWRREIRTSQKNKGWLSWRFMLVTTEQDLACVVI